MTLRLNYVAASDKGLVRGNNEDSAYAGPHLLLLADGMGGHAAGEVASQLMVSHMEHLDRDPGDADMLALLGAAADDANATIERSVAQHPEQEGMGTTLTALMFNGAEFGLIHVGDSRGYLLRDGQLRQITEDDTFVQSLVNEGKLDPEDVSSHPQKSLILKAYTGNPVEPHLEMVEVRAGDRVLLCSDGLSDPVTASTIGEALGQGTPSVAAQRLIELALRSGGPDNITVVIADVVEVKDGEEHPDLPTSPALAGALAPEFESTHPDSSASRAAALMRKSETIPPNHNREGGRDGSQPGAGDASADEEDDQRFRRKVNIWPWVLSALVIVLMLSLAAVLWTNDRLNDRYFLGTDGNDGHFAIERAVGTSLFSEPRREVIQRACINEQNKLQIVSSNSVPQDCVIFGINDLPESQLNTVENFKGGTYDDVLGILNRLAGEALPVCVDNDAAKDAPQGACREVK